MRKVGLLIPKTNLTVEYELQYLFNKNYFNTDKIIFYVSKLSYKTGYKKNKEKFLTELAKDEKNKIKDLKYLKLDEYAFFCTSSTLENKNLVHYLNPTISIVKISKKLNINSCLLITPYNEKIGKEMSTFLKNNNIDVKKEIHLNLLNTNEYFDFGINKLENLILNNYKDEYKNVIVSCTNIPTLKVIYLLKNKLNANIISSNSTMFEMLKEEAKIE